MPNRSRKPKRPRDINELGVMVAKLATGEIEEPEVEDKRNPAAVELGRLGGLKGGKARAANMTPDERRKSAQVAAQARWKKAQE
jgi:hypothetical protein